MSLEGSTASGRLEDTIREKVTIAIGSAFSQTHDHVLLRKLTTLLQPASLSITNDSWQHRHHTAMREQGGGNGETRMLYKLHQWIPRLYFDMFRFFDPGCFKCLRE